MPRIAKSGIDYFTHDVTMTDDKKIKMLIAQEGLLGYAIFNRLLEEIYRDEGYFLKADNDFNILFSFDCKIDLNVYIKALNVCINVGLFDSRLFEKFDILTSKRIQENYFAGTQRRDEVILLSPYLLADPLKHYNQERKNRVNVVIMDLNVDIKSENVDLSTQSKVKESKVKESKEKESKKKASKKKNEKSGFDPCKDIDLFLMNIPDDIPERWSQSKIDSTIEDMINYQAKFPGRYAKYKDYYAVLRTWLKNNFPLIPSQNSQQKPRSNYESVQDQNKRYLEDLKKRSSGSQDIIEIQADE